MKKKLFAITLLLSFYMMACGTKENVNPVESEVAIETEVETAVSETIDANTESHVANLLQERYADVSQLEIKEGVGRTDIYFEDRHFVCEMNDMNEAEYIVYNYAYYGMSGEFEKSGELLGEVESLHISNRNQKQDFEEGLYNSEYILHDLTTMTVEEVQSAAESTKDYILNSLEKYTLAEYVIVKEDVSWKYNEKQLSMSPQIPDGEHIRYYLLANTEAGGNFKLYDVYWEEFYPKDFAENNAESVQVTEVNTEEDAVELVKKQLIQAYENIYGIYEPSDVEPTLYSDNSERLAYIIPRLEVREETDEYYVIPVVWDFRVYKESGQVMVYYNGIDPMEYTFDPTNPNHLAFAG